MLKNVNRTFFDLYKCYSTSVHFQVLHNKKLKEFSLGEGSEKAVLQYQEVSPSIILLEHTIVPKSLQGKGFGKLLAEAAFEYAIDKNLQVKVSCDFVQKYLQKNPKPEFQSILCND